MRVAYPMSGVRLREAGEQSRARVENETCRVRKKNNCCGSTMKSDTDRAVPRSGSSPWTCVLMDLRSKIPSTILRVLLVFELVEIGFTLKSEPQRRAKVREDRRPT